MPECPVDGCEEEAYPNSHEDGVQAICEEHGVVLEAETEFIVTGWKEV